MLRLFYPSFYLFLVSSALGLANAQTILTCNSIAVPPIVRTEGIAERIGDIVLNCSGGAPAARITGNLSIFLSVNITNRVAGNTVTDVVFTVDNGSGPQPVNVPGTITGPSSLVYNGVSFTLSPTGTATLRIANIRAAADQLTPLANNSIQAFIGFNSASLISLTDTQVAVAKPQPGLYGSFSSKIICGPNGSPLPDNPNSLVSLLAANAVFASTRVTEGYADSFTPKGAWQGLNADTGVRIMVRYSGFPTGARLFIPNVVAGSDAIQPTAGGDFGLPASGGRYAPGGNGSLLLSLVQSADANGAGGTVVYTPGLPGSAPVSFDSMTEIALTNGSGSAVYEVVDANPSVQESAQFPTFLGLGPTSNGGAITTDAGISFAPVSTVMTASAQAPIPRFVTATVPPDCSIVGDCGAKYLPSLSVVESSLKYTAPAGSNFQVDYIQVQNSSGGVMHWTTAVKYLSGSGWLRLSPTDGANNGTIRVDALPGSLTPGTYNAILTIDAGPLAGTRDVPITLVITAALPPPVPTPAVAGIVNAATFAPGALAPGSIATLIGRNFSGASLSVTFDGLPGQILFSNDSQINVLVPAALQSKTSTQLVVQVNGVASASQTVSLTPFAPGIFKGGVLNQDNTVNGSDHPAQAGTVIQVFATGLSGTGVITARIGDHVINQPYYGGPAPGLPGVQQVDLIVPDDLTGSTAAVSVCGGLTIDLVVCGPPVQVNLAQ
jgi:uncharacterized protein (TIGR03437 family)